MKNVTTRYISASPIGKKQIIGSIFPEKLIFSENKHRTVEPNVILELISRPSKDTEGLKQEKVGDISDLFLFVLRTGIIVALNINALQDLLVKCLSKVRDKKKIASFGGLLTHSTCRG